MKTICQPQDFLGVNIYFGQMTGASKDGQPEAMPFPVGHAMTAFRFPVLPEALYWGPRFLWERYQLPIIITENGMSNVDWASLDGKVHDPQRIDFLHRYLLELQRACKHGVEVQGYFQWSILDNFEWTEGYKERYGLVYEITQRRRGYSRTLPTGTRRLLPPTEQLSVSYSNVSGLCLRTRHTRAKSTRTIVTKILYPQLAGGNLLLGFQVGAASPWSRAPAKSKIL